MIRDFCDDVIAHVHIAHVHIAMTMKIRLIVQPYSAVITAFTVFNNCVSFPNL